MLDDPATAERGIRGGDGGRAGRLRRPYDAALPVVVMDEKPLQLLADARPGTPAAPGQVARQDSEYIRCGTCSIFVWAEPLRGWRRAYADSTRTRPIVEWSIGGIPSVKTTCFSSNRSVHR